MRDAFRNGVERYLTPEQLHKLRKIRIGIAGAGGLGSNVAMILARCGIEQFVIIDHDTVEASNLNRQHYWPGQVGQPKVEAMADHLLKLNDHMDLQIKQMEITAKNVSAMATLADIWVEALDAAALKKLFVDEILTSGHKIVCASGIAGYGGKPLQKRQLGNLIAIGDFETSADNIPPLAPKVIQAAAMMADAVLEWALTS